MANNKLSTISTMSMMVTLAGNADAAMKQKKEMEAVKKQADLESKMKKIEMSKQIKTQSKTTPTHAKQAHVEPATHHTFKRKK